MTTKPRESLVDWVQRTTPAESVQTAKVVRAQPSAPSEPRLVPLQVWANVVFGEYAPHYNTLLRWVHAGKIQPSAKKIGRRFFVKPDAEFMDD